MEMDLEDLVGVHLMDLDAHDVIHQVGSGLVDLVDIESMHLVEVDVKDLVGIYLTDLDVHDLIHEVEYDLLALIEVGMLNLVDVVVNLVGYSQVSLYEDSSDREVDFP